MNKMILHFRNCCLEAGMSPDEYFVFGRGCMRCDGRYHARNTGYRADSVKYIVQYCEDKKVFLAWNLRIKPKRIKFSVRSDFDYDVARGGIGRIGKHVEYPGWNEEDVLVFNQDSVQQFLSEYVKEGC